MQLKILWNYHNFHSVCVCNNFYFSNFLFPPPWLWMACVCLCLCVWLCVCCLLCLFSISCWFFFVLAYDNFLNKYDVQMVRLRYVIANPYVFWGPWIDTIHLYSCIAGVVPSHCIYTFRILFSFLVHSVNSGPGNVSSEQKYSSFHSKTDSLFALIQLPYRFILSLLAIFASSLLLWSLLRGCLPFELAIYNRSLRCERISYIFFLLGFAYLTI